VSSHRHLWKGGNRTRGTVRHTHLRGDTEGRGTEMGRERRVRGQGRQSKDPRPPPLWPNLD